MLFLDQHSPGDDSANGSWVHLTVNCRKLGAGGEGGRQGGGGGQDSQPYSADTPCLHPTLPAPLPPFPFFTFVAPLGTSSLFPAPASLPRGA